MKGKENTFEDVFVRREKVQNALNQLFQNTPVYRDIKSDTFASQWCPMRLANNKC